MELSLLFLVLVVYPSLHSMCTARRVDDICSAWTGAGTEVCNFMYYDPFVDQWVLNTGQGNASMLYCGWCSYGSVCQLVSTCPTINDTFNGSSACRVWDGDDMSCNFYIFDPRHLMWIWHEESPITPEYIGCGYCSQLGQCTGMTSSVDLTVTCGSEVQDSVCNRWASPFMCNTHSYCSLDATWIGCANCDNVCVICGWCPTLGKCIDVSKILTHCPALAEEPVQHGK